MSKNRILRKPEVVHLVGLSYVSIWRLEREGKFPKRLQLGGRAVGWRADEIEQWITERPAANGNLI